MTEQPGDGSPDGNEDGGAEDFGMAAFGPIAGGNMHGLPQPGSPGARFAGRETDAAAGKRTFGEAIGTLNAALLGYEQVLHHRNGDIAAALRRPDEDPGLFASSDGIHAALQELSAAHQVYTGDGIPNPPRERGMPAEPIEPGHPQATADQDRAADDAQQSPWPRPHELGATVFLDRILHQDAEGILRLDTAKVFGNGVILVIDYVNLRGKGEDGLAWFGRSEEPHGSVELELALRDAATGAAHACTWHGGEGSVGPACYTLQQHFWIDRALEAGDLRGSLTVNNAIAADGTSEPLVVDVHLDTTVLREAATRIRTVATQWPRT